MHTTLMSHGGIELAEALQDLYATGQTDYSFEPIILADSDGTPIGRIQDGDSIVFCLRRGEREIQLTEAFVDPVVGGFPRLQAVHLPFVILTLYHEKFKDLPVAFAPTKISRTLAEIISKANLKQLHISESEKFAHVTYFFNGGNHHPFDNELDVRIPSLRGIQPEQVPQLSLPQVADEVISGIQQGYDFIVVNFANGDVIGHTSNQVAKVKCAEIIDQHLGQVVDFALRSNYAILVSADHGNLEEMINPNGTPNVSHTTNPVPIIFIASFIDPATILLPGSLADIAPTVLSIMGLSKPAEMNGNNLLHGGMNSKRLLLIILDGWGIGSNNETNPIYLGRTPNWDRYLGSYPHSKLKAAGENVGLQPGKNGNSEAGHMNIGAGRVVLQDDVRLDSAMQDGSFYTNEVLLRTIQDVKNRNSSLHLICLLSEKSSHGSIDYPLALLRMAKQQDLRRVFIHVIFDGRSTEPGSAPVLLKRFGKSIAEIGVGEIVTGIGRGIALDRDGNYQKTQCAYDAFVFGVGKKHCVSRG